MKILKAVTIFLLAAVLVAIAVVFSINGYHFNEEELLGYYCTVSEYGYSVDDIGDYSFDERRDLFFTGNFYNDLFKDRVLLEVRDTDDQLYWVIPNTYGGRFDIKHPNLSSMWVSTLTANGLYTTKTKLFIALNSIVVLLLSSPFMIGLALCKSKKIFIILLSIIGVIILAVLIFLIYTFVQDNIEIVILLFGLCFAGLIFLI